MSKSSPAATASRADRSRKTLALRSGRTVPPKPYHLRLTKRLPIGLTDRAYAALRRLAEDAGIGNNYSLTVLLENADKTIDRQAFRRAVAALKAKHAKPPRR